MEYPFLQNSASGKIYGANDLLEKQQNLQNFTLRKNEPQPWVEL